MQYLSDAPQEVQVSQVERKLNEAHQYADIILSLVIRLDARLNPVLRSSAANKIAEEHPLDGNMAPLAKVISEFTDKLKVTEDVLESILQRLEI